MNLSCGLVGFPNAGKSTLFNALLKKQVAESANYPFTTIEPNVGVVPVPDSRLQKLAEIEKEENKMQNLPPVIPAVVKFIDIAGLVKGAAQGEGLGNKFLSHIRETDIICHVVRVFADENVVREGSSDPESDYATVQTELILSDLQTVGKSKIKSQNSKVQEKSQNELMLKVEESLNAGIPVRQLKFALEEREIVDSLHFLTAKPEILVLNTSEERYLKENIQLQIYQYTSISAVEKEEVVVICAKVENELAGLSQDDQRAYLEELGIGEPGLERLIKKAYEMLGLISFLTAGEKEVRAWTIKKGTNAVDAAGVIHTDFTKKFIKAEVVSFDDFVSNGGWKGSRLNGKSRFEGRDYIIKDGDVVEFKIGS